MDAQSNQATHEGAVDADVLQVGTHAPFNLPHQILVPPGVDGVGNVPRRTVAQRLGQASHPLFQMFVDGGAQGLMLGEESAQAPGAGHQPLMDPGIGTLQIRCQPALQIGPQAVDIIVQGGMIQNLPFPALGTLLETGVGFSRWIKSSTQAAKA